jgi:erythronate-4-phosphate dehydrogenase
LKIVADDKIPFLQGVLEPFARVVYLPASNISRNAISDADALLIRTRTRCTESLLKRTHVKFIGTATIGFDHVDTHYCENNDIAWTNAPGCNSSSVQQYVTAALLKLGKDHKFSLRDKTIGIIGVGNVGSKVENLARALGMKVLLNDPPRARKEGHTPFVELDTLFRESDIITIHVPLNLEGEDRTWHLFDDINFGRVRNKVWFINSSRGEVVETAALKSAIQSGKISGAVLDVWENEPDIDRELLSSAYIATPHIAGYSTDGKANGTAMVVNSLCRHFNLPLKNWYPENVPDPESPLLTIDCSGRSEEEILREAVMHTYDIQKDDYDLRISQADFEKQRGNYRLRREFTAFTVRLIDGTEAVSKMLSDTGFRVH